MELAKKSMTFLTLRIFELVYNSSSHGPFSKKKIPLTCKQGPITTKLPLAPITPICHTTAVMLKDATSRINKFYGRMHVLLSVYVIALY